MCAELEAKNGRLIRELVEHQTEIANLWAENERLQAILRTVAECTENDDVVFGSHLCIEQVRIEVAKVG